MSWPMVKLGDVASFVRGITFKPDDVIPVDSAGAVACMRTKNVQEHIDLSDVWGIPHSFVKRPGQFVREGDLLVSTANSWNLVGKCSWVPELPWPTTVGGFIAALRSDGRIDPRFLYHWFASSDVQARVRNCARQTTNIANLSFDRCLDLALPLPSLSEQKRLAAILDQAANVRALAIGAKQTLKAVPESLFFHMFGDPESPTVGEKVAIDSVAELINGDRSKNYPSGDDLKSSGVLFLNTSNLVDGRLMLENCNFITEEKFASISRGKLQRGDVIITLRGTLGQCALFDCAEPTGFINAQMMIIRSGKKVIPRYLLEVLRFRSVQARLQRENSGTAVPQLTAAQIGRFQIPVPAIDWQRQFVDAVDKVANKLRLLEERSNRMSLLFTSLQHAAFRGEL